MSELIRQRSEREHFSAFLERLGQHEEGVELESSEWIAAAACDEHLGDYYDIRERLVGDNQPSLRTTTSLAAFELFVGRLCELLVADVIAIPRTREVGCARLTPQRFAALAVPLLLADGDDLSIASVGGGDGAHLTTYEEDGERTYEMQVWGLQWSQLFA